MPLDPADLNTQIGNSFIQDEIAISLDRLYLSQGTKLEHDYYTGFALLPSARVTRQPNVRQIDLGGQHPERLALQAAWTQPNVQTLADFLVPAVSQS